MMRCPVCESNQLDYVGIAPEESKLGEPFSDVWRCCDCGFKWDEPWIDDDDTQTVQLPLFPKDEKSWDNYSS